MTAAGVGSLLICQRQLAQYREMMRSDAPSKLLVPLTPVSAKRARYDLENNPARIDPYVKRGLAWLASGFTTSSGPSAGTSIYYSLYGIERIGALADRDMLGRLDWFEQGRAVHRFDPAGGGSWSSTHGDVPNTVWAILFLTRSTAKSLRRIEIKRLGAGTLLGGRGLPRDLSSLTVAGGRVVSRPINGAVEGMLAVLEDPRADNADSALAGLVARYQAEGAGRAPAIQRPVPQAAGRSRPRAPPGRGVGPGPDRRPGSRARPDRGPGRRRAKRGRDGETGAPASEPQARRPGTGSGSQSRTAPGRDAEVARLVR